MNPYIRMLKMLLWRKSSPLFIFYLTYHDKKGIHWVTVSGVTATSNPRKTFLQSKGVDVCVCVCGGGVTGRTGGRENSIG